MSSQTSNAISVTLVDEAATIQFGEALGRAAQRGGIVFLEGTLGAGKTTMCRGTLRAFGHQGAVKSPTYTLVEAYEFGERRVFHFDLYRLGDPEELEYMGIRDYFAPGNLCLIEWPQRGAGVLPQSDLDVKVLLSGAGGAMQREVTVSAHTELGRGIMSSLRAELNNSKRFSSHTKTQKTIRQKP